MHFVYFDISKHFIKTVKLDLTNDATKVFIKVERNDGSKETRTVYTKPMEQHRLSNDSSKRSCLKWD